MALQIYKAKKIKYRNEKSRYSDVIFVAAVQTPPR
jgi:hypothetical protein